jgi:MYXO-CTERM domain-containing protein
VTTPTTLSRLLTLGPLASLALVAACTASPTPPDESSARAASALAPAQVLSRPGIVRPPPPGRAPRPASAPPPATTYPPTGGCNTPLLYYGGAIISQPAVVQVSWNEPVTNGTVPSSIETYLQSWWPAIVSQQAGYLAWLSEYNTAGLNGRDGLPGSNQTFAGFGIYVGLYRITPATANLGATLTDTQIAGEIVAQIGAGTLPAPTYDSSGNCNTIYMIDFPPSVTSMSFTFAGTTANSCTDWCGYHGSTKYLGKDIYYGVHPDFTAVCTTCAPDGLQQDVGLVHSHELAEAMTDAQIDEEALTATSTDFMRPGAWDNFNQGCSEIGDSCAWPTTGIPTVTYNGAAFYVQGLFDNAHLNCATSGATTTTQCTSNAQCTGSTPICDSASHTCRACVATDCSGTTPICDAFAGSCRACVATDCSGTTPICDAIAGSCRACVAGDCSGVTAVCDAPSGQCVQCDATNHSACVTPTAVCDANMLTCRGCIANSECSTSTNHVCNTASGVCVACVSDGDCSSHVCDTTRNVCVQCINDSECSNPTPVCNTTGDTCGPCQSDFDCSANTHGHACSTSGSCVQCTGTDPTACPPGSTCNVATETCQAAGGNDGGSGSSSGGHDGGSGSHDAGPDHDGGSESEDGGDHPRGDAGQGGHGGSGSSGGATSDAGGGQNGGGGGCSVSTRHDDASPGLPAAFGLLLGAAVVFRRGRRR